MKKTLFVALAVGATAVGGLAVADIAQPSGEIVAIAEAREATAQFAVENMTCATCPISVKNAMKRVDGVKSVDVDFDTKIATVVFDPDKTTAAAIAAASTDVGYPASEIEA